MRKLHVLLLWYGSLELLISLAVLERQTLRTLPLGFALGSGARKGSAGPEHATSILLGVLGVLKLAPGLKPGDKGSVVKTLPLATSFNGKVAPTHQHYFATASKAKPKVRVCAPGA